MYPLKDSLQACSRSLDQSLISPSTEVERATLTLYEKRFDALDLELSLEPGLFSWVKPSLLPVWEFHQIIIFGGGYSL